MISKITNSKKFLLASTAYFIIFIGKATAIDAPFVVGSGDDITYNNDIIEIETIDKTSPITVSGGNLTITNSSFNIKTNDSSTPALKISSNSFADKIIKIIGSVDNTAKLGTSGRNSNVITISGIRHKLELDNVEINASGETSQGISVTGGPNNLIINNSKIISSGDSIYVSYSSTSRTTIELSEVELHSSGGYGVYLLNGNIVANDFTIETGIDPSTGEISNNASSSYGINANWYSKATLQNGAITTWGNNATGIWIVGNYNNFDNDIIDADNITINTNGNNALGLEANKRKALIKNSKIYTKGSSSHGLLATYGGSGTIGGVIEVDNTEINTEGAGALGLYAYLYSKINATGVSIITIGEGAIGVQSLSSGRVQLLDGSSIHTSGVNAHGVRVAMGSEITIENSDVVTVGQNAHGILLLGNNSTGNLHKNTVTVTNSKVESENGAALAVLGGAENTFTITGSQITSGSADNLLFSSADYVLSNDTVIPAGNVYINTKNSSLTGDTVINSGVVSYSLADQSVWTGAALSDAGSSVLSELSIDSTSRWNITDNSVVQSLTNSGTIAFTSSEDNFSTLTVQDAYTNSGGRFIMNAKLGSDDSLTDRILFEDTVSGEFEVQVINQGGLGGQTINGIPLIFTAGLTDAVFTLIGDYEHEGEQAVVAGLYAYKLRTGSASAPDDQNVYLRSELYKEPEPTPQPTPEPTPEPTPQPTPQPLYEAGVPLYEAYPQLLLGLNALPTMHQRVGNRYWYGAGNLSMSQGADAVTSFGNSEQPGSFVQANGIWGRFEGSHSKINPRNSTASGDYDFNALKIQAGIDGLLSENENGQVIGGLTAHYTHGKMNVESPHGRGDIKSDGYGFGGTLTWYGDNGFYVDGQGQVTWYRTDLYSATAKKLLTETKNHGFGYTLSVEAGHRVEITEDWSFTPQAQLQYSNINFDDFSTKWSSSTTDVSLSKADSLLGRLGISFDYQKSWFNDKGLTDRSVVYVSANLYNEFLNGTKVKISGKDFINKSERIWGGVGVGAAYNWNADKYSVYGEGSMNTSFKNFADSYVYKGSIGLRVKW
ncbi:autotransporter outer membrane beta-barrel domain-containing protein [Brucellaceae bacterium C25G]